MAHTSTAPLASAITLAGGLGVLGGLNYTPPQLRTMIHELKSSIPPSAPFGVDLALPKLGPGARATNHDYTSGQLDALIDVIISERATLFVSAVGVPPASAIAKLHAAGVLVMNMVGAPRHAEAALRAGVDIVCAQGGEGGGHTGDIPSSILVPAVVDVARKFRPPLLGGARAMVVAAGGVHNGRGLAASLMQGAVGVWVGTRFVASEEAGCSRAHKEAVVGCGWGDTVRTLVVSGRPLRVRRNEYIQGWEERPERVRELTEGGVVPMIRDLDEGEEVDFPFLMGQVAGAIGEVKPARVIVEEMVREAVEMLRLGQGYIGGARDSKL
ncbi:2-nitropropane dioxygenase [Lasallia pustulata]|uniref:2-nitropropane dioxygenase n=1 Tax=Lasallia pustulata TaxID=136370 RepID=A0A1W5CUI8_9LECA|nr:2-nitropropane dioxygenase [Lasallia pustulata]